MELLVSLILITLATLFLAWLGVVGRKKPHPLPPGPPADPIIGHVRHIPTKSPELTYMQWGKQFNTDIIYMSLLGQGVIILNKAEDAIALLDRRGSKYSDRPRFHFFQEQGWIKSLTLFSPGPAFRKHRKMYTASFTPAKCVQYQKAQIQEAGKLARRVMDNPEDWMLQTVAYSTAVVLQIAYGIEVKGKDDPYVKLANDVSESISTSGAVGVTMVDVLPFTRNLPNWFRLIPSLNWARSLIPVIREMHELPYEYVKSQMVNSSLSSALPFEAKGFCHRQSTAATISIFVLAMVLSPDVQQKAHAEIDAVVGVDRLPTFADRPNLPFVEKVLQELFRWHSSVPLSNCADVLDILDIPHIVTEDDEYKGYLIPKGKCSTYITSYDSRAFVIANSYAINRDECRYNNPASFNPDRYTPITEGGEGAPQPVGQFGFGRRICPGQHLGEASVWAAIVTTLATLEISKARDSNGELSAPDPKFSTGLTSHAERFPCVIKRRSERARELLVNL
ncbi:cytochrome P450 [Amylocarpus encephaloides]|uniref:Cytochrome P450 n=1 Tax=Amylocarpus encephaloides TaxID=45428 RepID=A0A9P7YJ14_9HELO|nr:cytochrome P450 [Amylocarpus encephaloides]